MKSIVLGGAGFIGSNLVERILKRGGQVVVVDNLSRAGADANLSWLQTLGAVPFHHVDIRHHDRLKGVFAEHSDASVVYHEAAQVAVTTSVDNPREDFEINALGTLNVLEAMRTTLPDSILLFASTNKVYGGLENLAVRERDGRYGYVNKRTGVDENTPLDFHSPYGCSKGAADQYVRDYARMYGLRTVVCRQSCIYGRRQFGVEDQGWIAWFTIATALKKPITIFGDGRQVRDVLFIDDLIDFYLLAVEHIDSSTGEIYNIGGGPNNTLSLLELIETLERLSGERVTSSFAPWRPGDQRVFISDISKARSRLGWSPRITPLDGITELHGWTLSNLDLFR